MKINRRVMLAGGVVVAGAAAAPASTHTIGGGHAERKLLDKLRDYVEQHRADWGLPGMTVCVIDRAGFQGFVTSGLANVDRRVPVGPDHLFQVGSISKMMGALAIWSLIEEGKLSPEARLKDLLPEIPVRNGDDITLQNLLNHTSGLPDDTPLFAEGGLWSGYAPGSHWSYSNTGYLIAGTIAANKAKSLYPEFLASRVLKPLAMMRSVAGLHVEDRSRYAQGYEAAFNDRPFLRRGSMTPTPWVDSDDPAGCVAATAGDMARFLRYLLALAGGNGAPILSDTTAKRFLASPADAPGWAKDAKYGNGIARVIVDGRNYLHHTGGMVSFSSSLHVDAEAGVAAFASSNVHYALGYRPRDVTVYACELLRALREGGPAPTPKPTKSVVKKPEQFKGVFTAKNGDSFEIVVAGDQVFIMRKGVKSEMQPGGEGFFACRAPDFAETGLQFDLEKGAATRAWAGEVEYAADPAAGYRPPAPPELRALAGRYDNDSRWAVPVRVYARDGRLWFGWFNENNGLTSIEKGLWRYGKEDWSPERVRFDGVIDGRPHRMMLSGTPYTRRFS